MKIFGKIRSLDGTVPLLLSADNEADLKSWVHIAEQQFAQSEKASERVNFALNMLYTMEHKKQYRMAAWIKEDTQQIEWSLGDESCLTVPMVCAETSPTEHRFYPELRTAESTNLSTYWLKLLNDFFPPVCCIEANGSGISFALQANQKLQTNLIVNGESFAALTDLDEYLYALIDGLKLSHVVFQTLIQDSITLYQHQYTFKTLIKSMLDPDLIVLFENKEIESFAVHLSDNRFILLLLWARVSVANKWQLYTVKNEFLQKYPESYRELIALMEQELLLVDELGLLLKLDSVFAADFMRRLAGTITSAEKARAFSLLRTYYLPSMEYMKNHNGADNPNQNVTSKGRRELGHNLNFQLPLISDVLNHCIFHFEEGLAIAVDMDVQSDRDLTSLTDQLLLHGWLQGYEIDFSLYLGSIPFERKSYFKKPLQPIESVDQGRLPAACPRDPEILNTIQFSCVKSDPTGSRGLAAGSRELKEPNTTHQSDEPRVIQPMLEPRELEPISRLDEVAVIVGFSARLPGCKDLNDFWQLLLKQEDAIGQTPINRLNYMQDLKAAFIDGVDEFDPEFFNISPLEAKAMDPQQRLLLQEVWRALEMASIDTPNLQGSATGVYVGASAFDYTRLLARNNNTNPYIPAASAHCLLANRISYYFDLRGPSETIDTGCSSSLYALDRAVKAIRQGEIDQAIVCGVNLLLDDELFNADGTIRGEGIIALILQKQTLAEGQNNTMYAKILASAVNHSGKASSLTSPSAVAQQQLYEGIYSQVDINRISYVEANGFGIDPTEMEGWKNFSAGKSLNIKFGSVKGNIGHLESASGLAGLIKVLLMFQQQVLPGQVNLTATDSAFALNNTGFSMSQKSQSWPETVIEGATHPRCAAVSSFGFGGTNAHVVLEQGSVFMGYGESDSALLSMPSNPFQKKKFWFETNQSKLIYREEEVCIDNQIRYQPISGKNILFIYSACFEVKIKKISEQLADSNTLLDYVFDDFNSNGFADFLRINPNIDRILIYIDISPFNLQTNFFEGSLFNNLRLIFEVVKSILSTNYGAKNLEVDVFSYCSQRINNEMEHPQIALISGLLSALSRELPHWQMKHVDTDKALDLHMIESSVAETYVTMRFCHNRYLVKTLVPAACTEEGEFLHADSVYLILGDLSSIGQRLTQYLVDNYQAKVVIIGRKSLDEVEKQFIHGLGTSVEYIQIDITEEVQCGLIIKYLSLKYPSLESVFDTHIQLADADFETISWKKFSSSIEARLLNAYFIMQLQQELKIKSAVIFSSIQSYDCLPGHANFAAASCGLDAYCKYLATIPDFKIKIINWSIWHDKGVDTDALYLKKAQDLGFVPLTTQQAWEAMLTGLSSHLDQFAVQNKTASNIPQEVSFKTGLEGVNEFVCRLVADIKDELFASLNVVPKYAVLVDYLSQLPASHLNSKPIDQLLEKYCQEDKQYAAYYRLSYHCYLNYIAILTGKLSAAEVLFSQEGIELLTDIYAKTPEFYACNQSIVKYIAHYLKDKAYRVRILELGAGLGSTTSALLPLLNQYAQVDYFYTDVSAFFLNQGKKLLEGVNFNMQFHSVTTNHLAEFENAEFDIVIASRTLHLTRNLCGVLKELNRIIKGKGIFLLNEALVDHAYLNFIFGLFDGWWQATGPDRLNFSPLLNRYNWQQKLQESGFIITADDIPSASAAQGVFHCQTNSKKSGLNYDNCSDLAAIIQKLSDFLRLALYVPNEQFIESNRALTELGLDSITGVSLITQINQAYNLSLRLAVIFDYPTLEKLAVFIHSKLCLKSDVIPYV